MKPKQRAARCVDTSVTIDKTESTENRIDTVSCNHEIPDLLIYMIQPGSQK